MLKPAQADYEEAVVNFRQTLYAALSDVENAWLHARITQKRSNSCKTPSTCQKGGTAGRGPLSGGSTNLQTCWLPRRAGEMPNGHSRWSAWHNSKTA